MSKSTVYIFFALCFFQNVQGSSSSSDTFITAKTEPLLIYNMFTPSFGMSVDGDLTYWDNMTAFLPVVREMNFNTVWVSPFTETSGYPVMSRIDAGTDYQTLCSHSIYTVDDLSRIQGEPKAPSTGDPGYISQIAKAKIVQFTSRAKELGLEPIFDLAVSFVLDGSPLASNSFSYFQEKGIDTAKWFHKESRKIDYGLENNGREVFEYLWKPYLYKMINTLGFTGIRFDYAAVLSTLFEKPCIDYIKSLLPSAIIFGEILVGLEGLQHVTSRKELGFSHITGSALWLKQQDIIDGSYKWYLRDLAAKKGICTPTHSKFRTGVIGFAGSHDDGTALQANCTTGNKWNATFWGTVKTTLAKFTAREKLRLAKERIAIAAFGSDAGHCLLSGDESLSVLKKNVFLEIAGAQIDHSEDSLYSPAAELSPEIIELRNYIKQINTLFVQLRPAVENFSVEILEHRGSNMIFVRHLLSESQQTADIVYVSLSPAEQKKLLPRANEIKEFVQQSNKTALPRDSAVYTLTATKHQKLTK